MFGILLCPFIFGITYLFFKSVEKQETSPVEDLKNALLIYALNTIYPEDFDDYSKVQGECGTLPPLFTNWTNTSKCYFNYIMEHRDGVSAAMVRNKMIEKYLESRFQTREDAEIFFDIYRNTVDDAFETDTIVLKEDIVQLEKAPTPSPTNPEPPKPPEHTPHPLTIVEDDYAHVSHESKKDA